MQVKWAGRKWEYKTETYRTGRNDKTVSEAMCMAGEHGWEVFHMIPGAEFYVLWYKRCVDPKPFT
jgi:hypothetical protein